MNSKPVHKQKNSMRTFFLFCSVVGLLVLGSLSYKLIQSVRASVFNPSDAFIVGVVTKNGAVLYNILPQEKEMNVLRVTADKPIEHIGKTLGIGVATQINAKNTTTSDTKLKSIIPTLFTTRSDVTWLDTIRLLMVVGSKVEPQGESIVYKAGESVIYPDMVFSDPQVLDEGLSIAVVNATGVSGVGARLERLLVSFGCSVVSVTTAQKKRDTSQIHFVEENSYTLKKITSLLGYQSSLQPEGGSSDILIILGEDSLQSSRF